MSQPEFSFIIATHNEDPAILAATVQGLRQLGPPEVVEIIVVDDASDGPVLISDMKGTTHLRIFSGAVRRGIAKARNVGVEMSRGRTLIFTDAHVAFSRNILDVLRSSGVADGEGIRGCETAILHHPDDLKFAASGGVPFSTCFLAQYLAWKLDLTGFPKVVPISAGTPVDDQWENVPYVGGCCLAISRKLFDDLGGFSECLVGIGNGGDLELAIRCHAVGLPVRSTRAATCYHLTENRKHEIEYSDPLSAYDLDRYPGSTTNILRTVGRYIDSSCLVRAARERGIYADQIIWLFAGDGYAFRDRMMSIQQRFRARGGQQGELRQIMTAGTPL